jgi:MinD superfamily P-loop ATPase
MLHEVVIISGKGGTGKTSLTAAFAHVASNHVICDLDVDAPDLHLLLDPKNTATREFISGHTAVITDRCDACGQCIDLCRFDAIRPNQPHPWVNPLKCEGCKVCVALCPLTAIDFPEKHCGNWHISDTRLGPMVHAQLFPGEENSGRLVTLLKREAKALAQARGSSLILSDGPPGIGCPVISSLAGANLAVVVTEPTPSGVHDLERVVDLCGYFRLPAGIIINKCDLNPDQSRRIKAFCSRKELPLLGELPHDTVFTEAMIRGLAVTEFQSNGIVDQIRQSWIAIEILIETLQNSKRYKTPEKNVLIQNQTERRDFI